MATVDELTQILYEMSMAIGEDLDLEKMLQTVALTTLRKLNSTAFVVYEESAFNDGFRFERVFITPRVFSRSSSYRMLEKQVNGAYEKQGLEQFYNSLPAEFDLEGGECFHLMTLPGYGVLAVFRKNGPLPQHFIYSMTALNRKLAVACRACLFSSRMEQLVQERTRQLEQEKQKAEVANNAKSDFLSRMSHELRTPLNAILGFSQILEARITEDMSEEIRISKDNIAAAGKHLLMLIDDVLDLVKIEKNKIDLPVESVDLDRIVQDSLVLIENQLKAQALSLEFERTGLFVRADERRLKQVLVNLLSNAIKYNRQHGAITIAAKPARSESGMKQVVITVEDTGVGIDPEERELIFQPFTRLAYASRNEIQGTGIGLALTKFLVEQMSGTIAADGTENGSVFSVCLPSAEPGQSNGSASKPSILSRSCSGTILYIEDNPASRDLMRSIFMPFPEVRLLLASSAEEGIGVAREEKPAVIFMDINLPGINGIEAVKKLRNDPALSQSRMIALSADAMQHQIEAALAAGFDHYLTKPVDINDIVAQVERFGMSDDRV